MHFLILKGGGGVGVVRKIRKPIKQEKPSLVIFLGQFYLQEIDIAPVFIVCPFLDIKLRKICI